MLRLLNIIENGVCDIFVILDKNIFQRITSTFFKFLTRSINIYANYL